MIEKNPTQKPKIIEQFETYLATVEAAIGQSLDDNTAKELRWAYCAGACAAFGLLKIAAPKSLVEREALAKEFVDVGFALVNEMRGQGVKWKM